MKRKQLFSKSRLFSLFLATVMFMGLMPTVTSAAPTIPAANVTHGYLGDFSLVTAPSGGELLAKFVEGQAEYDLTTVATLPVFENFTVASNFVAPNGKKLAWRLLKNGGLAPISGTNYTTNTFGHPNGAGAVFKPAPPSSLWTGNLSLRTADSFGIEIGLVDTGVVLNGSKAYTEQFSDSDVYQFNIKSLTAGLTSTFKIYDSMQKDVEYAIVPPITPSSVSQRDISISIAAGTEQIYVTDPSNADYTATIGTSPENYATTTDVDGLLCVDLTKYTPEADGEVNIPIKLDWKTGNNDKRIPREYDLTVIYKDYYPTVTTQPTSQTITVDKGETVQLTVSGENSPDGAAAGAELTYQWGTVSTPSSSNFGPIAGATSAQFDVPTDRATYAGQYYKCQITSTVNGRKYSVLSDASTVIVNLTYVSPAVNLRWENSSIELKIGQSVENRFDFDQWDAGFFTSNIKYYRNSENSTTGGELIAEREHGSGSHYALAIPPEFTPCTYYYYAEVVLISRSNSDMSSAPVKSDTLAVTFTGYDNLDFTGEGTAEAPYLINSISDFEKIRNYVNDDMIYFAGINFKMTADITLPADWTPIGCVKPQYIDRPAPLMGTEVNVFSGILDGDGHLLTIAEGGKPLFTYVRKAEVKNLNIYGAHINGAGLVDEWFIDYGENGDYWIGDHTCITVTNVTLKSGSQTLRSGLVEGSGSGVNNIFFTNCTVEEGVIIGYDKSQQQIGSLSGFYAGRVSNCISYATVYGTDRVGGLVGVKNQSMGLCDFVNSAFIGTVEASGHSVGGIIGSGYGGAAGTPTVSVKNCYVVANITGEYDVGGILGSETGVKNAYPPKSSYGDQKVTDNIFYGTLTATGADGIKGGIIGSLGSYNKNQLLSNNHYLNTSAATGIGWLGILHLKADVTAGSGDAGIIKSTVYDSNGTDSFDARLVASPATAAEFANGAILAKLNSSATSYKNWVQLPDSAYPTISDEDVIVELSISGEYKTEYYIGDALDLTGITLTAHWSNGDTSSIPLSEVTVTGYDKTTRGVQTLTVTYGAATATFQVTVLKRPEGGGSVSDTINVSFTLLGAPVHDSETDGVKYLKKSNNLETWISKRNFTVDLNARVADVLKSALDANGMTWQNPTGNYVEAIIRNGAALAQFTNGPHSGWVYMLNGEYSLLGVNEQFLESGDDIVFHYTDDWTADNAADIVDPGGNWRGPDTPSGGAQGPADTGSADTVPPVATETIEAKTTVNAGTGKAIATVETAAVTKAVAEAKKAVADAKASGDATAKAEVKIIAKAEPATIGVAATPVKSVEVDIPAEAFKAVAESKELVLTVESDVSTLTLDTATLTAIAKTAKDGETIKIAAETVDTTASLNDRQREKVGDNPVIEVNISVGTTAITNLGGTVTVSVPYKPESSTTADDYDLLTVYYLDDDGNITEMKGARYDATTGKITFATTHFSKFLISEWINPFNDITKGEWFYKAARYAYSNTLITGTTDTTFAPQATLTRAMLITILARDAGIDTTGGYTWYSKAVDWGMSNNLTDGTNMGDPITREQFATLLYRYTQWSAVGDAALGVPPSSDTNLSAYTDAESISDWAQEAMAWAVSTGLITGRTATTLAPELPANRAEAAMLLQRYLEIIT
jgi:hypothetical protein